MQGRACEPASLHVEQSVKCLLQHVCACSSTYPTTLPLVSHHITEQWTI